MTDSPPDESASLPDVSAGQSYVRYSIGDVARHTGLSASTIRMFEREGLIRPERTAGGHRKYTTEHVRQLSRVRFLRIYEQFNAAAIRRVLGADQATEETPTVSLGQRLRSMRVARGLSLAEVGARTGLSLGFISAVERGKSSISSANLARLAEVYGTTPDLLESGDDAGAGSANTPERPRFVANERRVSIEELITGPSAMEARRFEIQPGGRSSGTYSHPGEEFLYVLQGQLTFWIDEYEQHVLYANDSLHLKSTRLHRWCNEGDETTIVVWVGAPLFDRSR